MRRKRLSICLDQQDYNYIKGRADHEKRNLGTMIRILLRNKIQEDINKEANGMYLWNRKPNGEMEISRHEN